MRSPESSPPRQSHRPRARTTHSQPPKFGRQVPCTSAHAHAELRGDPSTKYLGGFGRFHGSKHRCARPDAVPPPGAPQLLPTRSMEPQHRSPSFSRASDDFEIRSFGGTHPGSRPDDMTSPSHVDDTSPASANATAMSSDLGAHVLHAWARSEPVTSGPMSWARGGRNAKFARPAAVPPSTRTPLGGRTRVHARRQPLCVQGA